MDGYEEFKRIMNELEYKVHKEKEKEKLASSDENTLNYLKGIFGI